MTLFRGSIVFVKVAVDHPHFPDRPVTPLIPCTVQDILGEVVMLLPHNTGHEVLTYVGNIKGQSYDSIHTS